jgi:hypothetical protein
MILSDVGLIDYLSRLAMELTSKEESGSFRINNITTMGIRSRTPNESEPVFRDSGLLISSRQTGYVTLDQSVEEDISFLLGRDARFPLGWRQELALAALDSVGFDRFFSPLGTYHVDLPSSEKALLRGRLIARIVSLFGSRQDVLLVGAVGSIVEQLVIMNHRVAICDLDEALRATELAGIPVQVNGTKQAIRLVQNASIIVATGMSVVNGSIFELVSAALSREIPIVLFCQSCSHLAAALPESWPIFASICECFPNYFYSGPSTVKIFSGGYGDTFLTSSVIESQIEGIPWVKD